MRKVLDWLKKEKEDYVNLLRAVPAVVVSFFVLGCVLMNLLANKTIVQTDWLALDAGIVVSWLCFLSMDIITKHFGPKAATKISLFAIFTNLLVCGVFWVVSSIPSDAADYSVFNSILGGTWFILLGSTIAFICSAFINNFLNAAIGRMFTKNSESKLAYVTRTYVSTAVGQFVDNMIFAVIVFMFFAPIFWDGFCWTFIQCLTCSITGAIVELLFEIVFSPIGYKVCKSWKKNNIGSSYFNYLEREHR